MKISFICLKSQEKTFRLRNPSVRGFRGTCYKAANWIYLGQTTSRGKDDRTHKVNRGLKHVFGYSLGKDFRQALNG